jgi:small subunit ribosomal protein S11
MSGKKVLLSGNSGIIHIHAGSSNTLLSLTTPDGDTLAWTSCGKVGFKGSRQSTPYAAQAAAEQLAQEARTLGIYQVQVTLKGLGKGRYQAVKGLQLGGLKVVRLEDKTPMPHNGCRRKKKRRL